MPDALPAIASGGLAPAPPEVQRSPRRRIDWLVWGVVAAAVLLTLLAAAAPLLAPFDPNKQSLLARLRPPVGFERADGRYLLGTDQLGRDLVSRCLHGLRLTLALAFAGTVVGLVLGSAVGLVAGFAGGVADALLMGLVDVKLSLPFTLVALFVIAVAGTGTGVLVGVLGLAYWPQFARLVRGQVIQVRALPYVEAARATGASAWRVATRHMLPNLVGPIIVLTTLTVSNLILLESSLSFIGIGVQPPTATLGSMVGQGRDYMASAPWIVAAPALLIMTIALVVMLLGDALRDRLDPRLTQRLEAR